MPKKILVVEDTEDARAYIESVLRLESFDVVLAADGLEGLEQARLEMPDLVITDLSMPRLSGLEMIRRLRTTPALKNVPILAITSHGTEKAVQAIRVGANRAVARPIDNHLLLAFVFDLLSGTQSQ
jgi:two-component system response regulator MprA/two-component system response regulator PrrA